MFLRGFGGTGKTFAARQIAKASKKPVLCTAYTHTASQCIATEGCSGGTLHHCLFRFPNFSGLIIIDEANQIPLVLWAAIQRWLFAGAQFVVLGDFNQFPPAFNRWRRQEITQTVENTCFFKTICGHNRVHFNEYKRGDDPSFFRLYTSLVGVPVGVVRERVKQDFPPIRGRPNGR